MQNESEKPAKSAVDEIYKIREEIDFIKKYLILIDNNLKLISNKLNKLSKEKDTYVPPKQITATPGTPLAPREKKEIKEGVVLGKIKVFGYIVNSDKTPIQDVDVNIFDDNNNLIKHKTTNKDGYWDVRLPPGKYGVEYIQKNYHPINKIITLDKLMTSFEVK